MSVLSVHYLPSCTMYKKICSPNMHVNIFKLNKLINFKPQTSSPFWERVSGTPAPGDGGPLLHGDYWLPGYSEPSGGGDPSAEGGDGETPAGVPGPSQRQAGPGYWDCHLQEAAGGRGEQVRQIMIGNLICPNIYRCQSVCDCSFPSLFLKDHHSSSELFQPAVQRSVWSVTPPPYSLPFIDAALFAF